MVPARASRALLSVLFFGILGPAAAAPRVVVIGFDGADAALTRRFMAEGRLPNLSALAEEGGFAPLLPTNPPQTPVSWSTFATGLDPGRTEIFDFLKRNPSSYLPAFCAFDETHRRPFLFGDRNPLVLGAIGLTLGLVPALFALRSARGRGRLLGLAVGLAVLGGGGGAWFARAALPTSVPDPVNNRKGRTFWELAAQAGLRARILRVPLTFPADRLGGLEMISGLGVPDVRGLVGQPTLYTTRAGLSGGQFNIAVVDLPDLAGESVVTHVAGPRNVLFPQPDGTYTGPRIEAEMRVTDLGEGRLRIELGGTSSEVGVEEWSAWHDVDFRLGPLATVHGMTRFYNQSRPGAGGHVELVMSPIHFHPAVESPVRWCHPGDYGPSLVERVGLFKTMGWAIDTWTVSEDLASETHCLEDAEFTAEAFEDLMVEALSDEEVDLFVQVFAFTDRIQHVFLRLSDPTHPGYDAALARKHEGVVARAYERMDAIVGRARSLAPEDATFVVLSDHGFAQFRRGVNLNRWLVNHGYMVLAEDPCASGRAEGRTLHDLFEDKSRTFARVDWSRTRAYALGLGNIYVNLAGREGQGIVRPGREYDELVAEIRRGLKGLVDPATGDHPVMEVHHRDEIYSGFDPTLVPDLRVANAPGYRVSWDTSLGGAPCEEVQDNRKPWGADHCSLEPSEVKGILFVNRPLKVPDPEMVDMAPTILRALGLPPPDAARGREAF